VGARYGAEAGGRGVEGDGGALAECWEHQPSAPKFRAARTRIAEEVA
jgi:hypothetical protein